jgi:hypothetical protein
MKKELDDALCNKYPEIFANRHKSMQETCMCWGFECGDGWYDLIDNLCGLIQNHIKWSKCEQVVAEQVKEKFGGLRFYYRGGDEYIAGAVAMADGLSYNICDVCGNKGMGNEDGWITTRCEEHQ